MFCPNRTIQRIFNCIPGAIRNLTGFTTDTVKHNLDKWLKTVPDMQEVEVTLRDWPLNRIAFNTRWRSCAPGGDLCGYLCCHRQFNKISPVTDLSHPSNGTDKQKRNKVYFLGIFITYMIFLSKYWPHFLSIFLYFEFLCI